MRLALEHLQHSIAQLEARLDVIRDAKRSVQAQLDEHTSELIQKEQALADLRTALAVLRAQSAETSVPVAQLQKTQSPINARKAKP